MNKPTVSPRAGGGFNPGMGSSFGEHMDENAMQQAVQQKALGQQTANAASASSLAQQAQQHQQQAPRPVGSLSDELIKRPVADIFEELKGFFSVHSWIGIEPAKDDPEKQAKQKQMVSRYNQLNADQQAVAKKRYQEEMQKRKLEEEEKEKKKQMEQQQKAQELPMPQSTQKGPVGPGGSKKQKAVQKLQNDRKTLSGPSSAN